MQMGRVKCQKCRQLSVRNIHNKCVYCGYPFAINDHLTDRERSARLDQIDATTDRLKAEVKQEKEREKNRRKAARRLSYFTMPPN